MQGIGEQRLTIFFPSEFPRPRLSSKELFVSEVFDIIRSIEKASAFGVAEVPFLGSRLGRGITVSKGRELAILAELDVSSSRLATQSSFLFV